MKLAKNIERLGTESAFKILAEAKKLEAEGKKIIHLSLGQPDFTSPKHVIDATKKALDDGHHGYVLPNGIIECREAVTRKIKKLYNSDIDPERVIIMPGGKPTMYYAITIIGEPGAEIIYPDPGFPIYESMINYTGAKAVPINMLENNDLTINPEKMAYYGLTVPEVLNIIKQANSSISAGDVKEGKREYIVRAEGEIQSEKQVEEVVLISEQDLNGRFGRVTVNDIANVEFTYKEPRAVIRFLGNQSIAINAIRQTGANVIDVMNGI